MSPQPKVQPVKDHKAHDEQGEPINFAVLFPGREVQLPPPLDVVKITVWPASVAQMRKFSEAISRFISRVSLIQFSDHLDEEARVTLMIPHLIPIVLDEMIDLVNECTIGLDLTVDRMPHWMCAPLVHAWLEESLLGEGKVEPWMSALKQGIDSIAKGTAQVSALPSTSATPSKLSSTPDTPSSPSSESSEKDAPIEGIPFLSTSTS